MVALPAALQAQPDWRAGTARVVITPRQPLWMAGYAARTRPSQGTLQEIYVRVLALEDQKGERSVLISADLLGFTREISNNISREAEGRYGLSRSRLLFNASHTHSGPVIARMLAMAYQMTDAQWRDVDRYTGDLEALVLRAIGLALDDLAPARLSFGRTRAEFGVNRRVQTEDGIMGGVNRRGPVDHQVPFMTVDGERGELRSIVFSYACHNTTIPPTVEHFHGDYSGVAQEWLEREYPGSVALFITGCGADINPYPRGTVALAERHGQNLAQNVAKSLTGPLMPLPGPIQTAYKEIELRFAVPTETELKERLDSDNIYLQAHARKMLSTLEREGSIPDGYAYPIQVWQFGSKLTLVALAGEVVVDYPLRLSRELKVNQLWVAGYSNDVSGYIPSRRILGEGGYEGGGAMIYYGKPGPFLPSVEESILDAIKSLIGDTLGIDF